MFKRILSLIVVVSLICCVSCTTKTTSTKTESDEKPIVQDNESQEDIVVSNKNKIQGEIELGTDFTNGLAFVKVKGNDKNYCIDKSGNILFELDSVVFKIEKDSVSPKSAATTGFYNDIALITDLYQMNYVAVCDKNGKLTTAEQLGVSYFLEDAIKDGYILAVVEGEKIRTDKIGVLNSKLEWIVEPSLEISKSIGMNSMASHATRFYYNFVLYGIDGSFNVTNGKLSADSFRTKGKEILATSVEFWSPSESGYQNRNGDVVIDIYGNPNLTMHGGVSVKIDGAKFVNGKAPIVFSDNTDWTRFSLVDIEGDLLFEPVSFGENIDYIQTDGDNILVVGEQTNHGTTARMYDLQGELVGELDPAVILINSGCNLQNGVVRISYGVISTDGSKRVQWVKYFNTELKPLF